MDSLKNLQRTCALLITHDKEMTLSRALFYLTIAKNDGCAVRDIVNRTGFDQSTVSRQLALLGDKPSRGAKEGLGWVIQRQDPTDARRVLCYLTPKGKQVLETLID